MTRFRKYAFLAGLLLAFGTVAHADYQVRDGNGNLITIKAGTTGAGETLPQSNPSDAFGNSLFSNGNPGFMAPTAPPPDIRPGSPTSVTIIDSGSATASGQNGVSFITGTPTALSTASFTLNGEPSARVEVTGTWAGTLEFESSVDGGLSWVPQACQVVGTAKLATTVTANGDFVCGTSGASNFRLRATAFSSGIASIWVNVTGAHGPVAIISPSVSASVDGIYPSYYGAFSFAPASAATDVLVLQGSATKIVKVRRIMLGGVATAAGIQVSLIRRSTGDTGGTSAGITAGIAENTDSVPTASLNSYSANPTGLGTSAGSIFNLPVGVNPATVGLQDRLNLTFGDHGGKPIVLHGTSDYLVINLNGATITTLYGSIEWTEEQ